MRSRITREVTNDTYITAETVCTLLQQLAALNLPCLSPFSYNARYQKCALVHDTQRASTLNCVSCPRIHPISTYQRL